MDNYPSKTYITTKANIDSREQILVSDTMSIKQLRDFLRDHYQIEKAEDFTETKDNLRVKRQKKGNRLKQDRCKNGKNKDCEFHKIDK